MKHDISRIILGLFMNIFERKYNITNGSSSVVDLEFILPNFLQQTSITFTITIKGFF